MSFTLRINPYKATAQSIEVSISQMQGVVDTFPETYAVKWNIGKLYKPKSQGEDQEATGLSATGNPIKKRKMYVPHLWYKTYYCHRSGEEEKPKHDLGGKLGQMRVVQKISKKIGRPATMKFAYYKSKPKEVVFTFINDHNHGHIDSKGDFQYLPVSEGTKRYIFQKLQKGFMCRDVRLFVQLELMKCAQDHFRIIVDHQSNTSSMCEIIHCDQLMDPELVYNQHKRIQENAYKRHSDQYESIKIWIDELKSKGYSAYIGDSFNNSYAFGFMSPWQKNFLLNSPYFCLDATHKTTNIGRYFLYTIVVRHSFTDTDCLVAFCFTTDHSARPIIEFLSFVKSQGHVDV
ncbi:hypothetical protein RMATCC62417_15799 [Rhizopus microsporus]|nr:hypothetical protein RMATCC62417_15799 [Rhizopus microsporus]